MVKRSIIIVSTLCGLLLTACAATDKSPSLIVGDVSSTTLLTQYQSFAQPFEQFHLSEQDLSLVKSWPSDLSIEVYFGIWCHDSQREVPKFLKLMEQNKAVSTKLVALDYQKSDPQGIAKSLGVKYTPTFIVYQNGKELGRIVERPKNSIVSDIQALL